MSNRLLWSCLINYIYFKSIFQGLFIQPQLFPLLLFLLLLLFPKTTTCTYPIAIIKKINIWYHHICNLFSFIYIIITISNNVVNTVIMIIPIVMISFTINFRFFVLLIFITFFLACLSFLFACACVCACVCVCVHVCFMICVLNYLRSTLQVIFREILIWFDS